MNYNQNYFDATSPSSESDETQEQVSSSESSDLGLYPILNLPEPNQIISEFELANFKKKGDEALHYKLCLNQKPAQTYKFQSLHDQISDQVYSKYQKLKESEEHQIIEDQEKWKRKKEKKELKKLLNQLKAKGIDVPQFQNKFGVYYSLFHYQWKHNKELCYQRFQSLDLDLRNKQRQNYATFMKSIGKSSETQEEEKEYNFKIHKQKSGEQIQPEKNLKQKLKFCSKFESGNLFSAFRKSVVEYDLILQNDLNTKGNTQWFFFQVMANNIQENQQEIQFNIINHIKNDSLFNLGMKPLIFEDVSQNIPVENIEFSS